MSLVKVTIVCGLTALLVSACGIQTKPQAGASLATLKKSGDYYGRVDNPLIKHVACLKAHKVKFRTYFTANQHLPAIQVGSAPAGPTMIFYPTAGIAQGLQIMGVVEGAEVIGTALLYPNQTSGKLLTKAEACASAGVS